MSNLARVPLSVGLTVLLAHDNYVTNVVKQQMPENSHYVVLTQTSNGEMVHEY